MEGGVIVAAEWKEDEKGVERCEVVDGLESQAYDGNCM